MIITSLVVLWDSLSFFSDCSARIFKRYRKEDIVASISLSTCKTTFSLKEHCFVNPNGKTVQTWVPKVVSKFHDDSMVKEFGIVFLLGYVWVYVGKEKAHCERHFFHHRHYLENTNGGCIRKISYRPCVQSSWQSNS